MLISVNQAASLVGADRATVVRRADQLGLVPQDGEKGAKLYDSRCLLQLVPIVARGSESALTKEEAQIRQIQADADVKELTAAKMRGDLVSVSEILAIQNPAFDDMATQIKTAPIPDELKESLLERLAGVTKAWLNPNS